MADAPNPAASATDAPAFVAPAVAEPAPSADGALRLGRGSDPPCRLGIALSGGGDSTALALIAARWGRAHLRAATVDHRLRPESGAEAVAAGEAAARLGILHDILVWEHGAPQPPGHPLTAVRDRSAEAEAAAEIRRQNAPDGETWEASGTERDPRGAIGKGPGNLQARARAARQALLAQWAAAHRLDAVLLGHTMDDQAETVLMRLERGSGADGLSAMDERVALAGTIWLRPLLGLRRAALRDLLRAEGIGWAEDPSNDDPEIGRAHV